MNDSEILAKIRELVLTPTTPAAIPDEKAWIYKSGPHPSGPLPDDASESDLKRYASWGLKMDGRAGVAPSDLPALIAVCERLFALAPDAPPEAADAIVARAGFFPIPVSCYLLLTGASFGFSSTLTPTLMGPASLQTIREAAFYSASKPLPGSPGPGVNP
jgi:hypothetical protein